MWMTEEFKKQYCKFQAKQLVRLFFYKQTPGAAEKAEERSKRKEDNRKWAIIRVGNTQKLATVDNRTMKAYKVDLYTWTWIEIKHFTFVRWATGFDV